MEQITYEEDLTSPAALDGACFDFALAVLKPGGISLAKVLGCGIERELLKMLKQDFAPVRDAKPIRSPDDSAELFVLAMSGA